MIRLLIIVVVVSLAIVTFMPDLLGPASDSGTRRVDAIREVAGGRTPQFQKRLEAGAGCAELLSIRDTYDPSSPDVGRMNDQLRDIGCDSATSTRIR
jgi:hypothetical protein